MGQVLFFLLSDVGTVNALLGVRAPFETPFFLCDMPFTRFGVSQVFPSVPMLILAPEANHASMKYPEDKLSWN